MSKLPSLIPKETIEIPHDCYWLFGLDENIYWWKKTKNQNEEENLVLSIYSENIPSIKEVAIKSSSQLLYVDKQSNFYFGQNLTIGNRVTVFSQDGSLLWSWEPDERIHSFAYTVDSHGKFWYVSTEIDDQIHSYSSDFGFVSYPLPKIDTVYGLAVSVHDTIYSNQLPTVGHFIVCSDFDGKVLHQIGEIDIERAYSGIAEDWEIYYPDDIFLDSKDRLWIDEMGRDCITIVDSSLNIIGRLDYNDFGITSRYQVGPSWMNSIWKYGFGNNLLWVKEPRKTSEIILHSYRIEDN